MIRRRAAAFVLATLPILLLATAAPAATIAGKVFTAESADSTAKDAPVTLLFHNSAGLETKRLETKSDSEGQFHFQDLPSDTSLSYVLQISYKGTDFLSNTIRFASGQNEVDYNVLLSEQPPADAGSEPMIQGRPAKQSPLQTILITLFVVALFSLFALLARREGRAEEREAPPEARALIREIAGLDVRREDGIIGEEEYRKVRSALKARLRSLSPRPTGNAG
jgi:hypothetical protein